MRIVGIIPARYESSRFPGKPLINIQGKTMIQRVYEQTLKVKALHKVMVATDDKRIYEHVESFKGNAMFTGSDHQSGTDRCREAADKEKLQDEDVIINIQGDEPFIAPEQIEKLCNYFKNKNLDEPSIATLVKEIDSNDILNNENKPKVVLSQQQQAIYFSRHAIPYQKNAPKSAWIKNHTYYSHIGIYGYTFHTLKKITALSPTPLEMAESLEQLRWLEHHIPIKALLTKYDTKSIDTPEDLQSLLEELR